MQEVSYSHIFVAGTFDGLHAGHQRLLTEAFRVGERVTIGLTSNFFISRYKSKFLISKSKINSKSKIQKKINSYITRRSNLESWLHGQSYFDRASIIPISDPHEPAASMKDLDGLIVTRENRKTGERINALRQGLALSPLALIEVPIVAAEDGKPISSTRLRNGEIDRDGRLTMPESMRTILGKPMGNILRGKDIATAIRLHTNDTVITVGDLSTKTILDAGVNPRLVIIDGKIGRKPYTAAYESLTSKARLWGAQKPGFEKVKSGPGFMSREAIEVIQDCFIHPSSSITHHVLIIDGEEDLLVLPVIQYAPLGSILYYGQPGEGLVEVIVTDVVKKDAQHLLSRFT